MVPLVGSELLGSCCAACAGIRYGDKSDSCSFLLAPPCPLSCPAPRQAFRRDVYASFPPLPFFQSLLVLSARGIRCHRHLRIHTCARGERRPRVLRFEQPSPFAASRQQPGADGRGRSSPRRAPERERHSESTVAFTTSLFPY
jgi:hypothetical protein